MDDNTSAELADLRHAWEAEYEITFDRGEFRAVHRDTGAAVRHTSAAQLGLAIKIDHGARSPMIP